MIKHNTVCSMMFSSMSAEYIIKSGHLYNPEGRQFIPLSPPVNISINFEFVLKIRYGIYSFRFFTPCSLLKNYNNLNAFNPSHLKIEDVIT